MARQRKRRGSANATQKAANPRISAFQAGQLLSLATCVAEGEPWSYGKEKGVSAEFSAEEVAHAQVVMDYLESGPADNISKSDPFYKETKQDFWAQWIVTETPEEVITAMDGFVESAMAKLAEAGVVINTKPGETAGGGLHRTWRTVQQKLGRVSLATPKDRSVKADAATKAKMEDLDTRMAGIENLLKALTEKL